MGAETWQSALAMVGAFAFLGAFIDFWLGRVGQKKLRTLLETWWLRLSYVRVGNFGREEARSRGHSTLHRERYDRQLHDGFRLVGIAYELSNRAKSDLYREMLPLLKSGKVELLDYPRLVLCGLERRTLAIGLACN